MHYSRLLIFLSVATYSIPAALWSSAPLAGEIMAVIEYSHWWKLLLVPFSLCSALSWVILIWLSLNWIWGRKLKSYWPNFGFIIALIGLAPFDMVFGRDSLALVLLAGPAMVLAFYVCAWHRSDDER